MGLFSKTPKGVIEEPPKPVERSDLDFRIEKVPTIRNLPDLTDKTKLNVTYPLLAPYAYAHIYWDERQKEILYEVLEPALTPEEESLLHDIEQGIEELINISFLNIDDEETVIVYLEKNIKVILHELNVTPSKETFLKLMYYVYRDFVGLNAIEPLLKDYFIEDIECNGVNTPLYIIHRKYRNLKTNITYHSMEELTSFVEKLAQKCGKYLSYANPLLDGRLADKSRVNATYTQEISSQGPSFTIRKFTAEPWSPVRLMKMRTLSPEILAYLWILIEHEANIMVIGGTGSGKTSMLNSLAFFIPPQARIVSIEDTRELNLLHENWLPSVSREAIGIGEEGKFGEISLFTLLKESFRQRPDYVIVGEIRGQEAYVLFQGSASGHPAMSTMHAEDVQTMIRRLETPPINLPPTLVETLDIVCVMTQAKVKGQEVRKLKSITEIIEVGKHAGSLETNTPFMWDPQTDQFYFKTQSKMFEKLQLEYGLSYDDLVREFRRRTTLLMELYKRDITDYKEVHDIINAYYKVPEEVLKKFNIP